MRFRAGWAWLLTLMLGGLGAAAPALAVEPTEQFFESLRESIPRYVEEDRVKTLALCLDFDRSTADRPVWQSHNWAYSPGNPHTHARLANHALERCNSLKSQRGYRACDCVIVARNHRYRLEASSEQLAKLATPRAPTLPLARRSQTEQQADHTPIAEPEAYSGTMVFGRGASQEWFWTSLTVIPTVAGATFAGTVGSHQCRGSILTEDRKSGTWDGHCDGRGSLWGTLSLENGFIRASGLEADGKFIAANLQRQ